MSKEIFTQLLIDIKENGAESTLVNIREQIQEMYDQEFYASVIMCVDDIVKLVSSLSAPHSFTIFTAQEDSNNLFYLKAAKILKFAVLFTFTN